MQQDNLYDRNGTDHALGTAGLAFLAGQALSPREQAVWQLAAAGCNMDDMAERLCLNSLTVRFHLSNLLAKQGALPPAAAVHVLRS